MLRITRIFGIVIVRGSARELESVAALRGIDMAHGDKIIHIQQSDKLVQVKHSHHVHANPGTFIDKQTIELPLESEDKKNG